MYQSNSQQQQQQQQQVNLEELDFANFVLSELKRSAREYTTAALEAANPGIRQTFEKLLQNTLDDQALIFQEIQKLGGYEIQPATQQLIQQELQKQSQTSVKVQSIVQQHAGRASAVSYTEPDQDMTQMQPSQLHVQSQPHQTQTQSYQQAQSHQPQHQTPSYTQQESQQHNQVAALHQTPTPSFQPVNYANQYPNAAYNNAGNRNNQQSQGYMPNNSQAQVQPQQQSSYAQTQGRGYQQDHSYGQSNANFGRETQGYAASANQGSEHMGATNRPAQARIISRNQPGANASTSGDNTNMNRSQEGNKYNF
ncbi:hypothetical protein A8709_20875 [Paenibacillus pectinilyticus]|uniref:Spore coat protein n=1 Tax=Paenibacillus pectinilyticus TaxID=512399 RepID=A0A1C0ZYU0_9BACL|nr:spore coat protein [Paenibacillus pectinilyticus]OCT13198.1 hypothetical protein A8709_20875 [Paenibacillus pectinilyticus]